MELFKKLDLSAFRQKIQDRITFFTDPVCLEIPDDPVLLSYIVPDTPRLMSKESIKRMQQENESSRALIQRHERDASCIAIALETYEPSNDAEELLKVIFLSLTNKTAAAIQIFSMTLGVLTHLALTNPGQFQRIFEMGDTFLEHIEIILLLNDVYSENRKNNQPILLPQHFFELQVLRQQAIIEENKKKLKNGEETLSSNEIICPVTRNNIAYAETLASEGKAKHFQAIFIYLSQLAQVNDDSLNEFLESKSDDYVQFAHSTFMRYLRSPGEFHFSPQEASFLDELGLAEARAHFLPIFKREQQLQRAYAHLWSESQSSRENALKVLIDYNKEDWRIPSLGLFFTGHWNRHHHGLVREAILNLNVGANLSDTLKNLYERAKTNEHFNPKGSLVSRLEYILYKSNLHMEPEPSTTPHQITI
ncbi:DUF5617 domain-containing protein [Legionella jordanis]|uniref:RavJ-like C-terminal domain-containing protein n=1 Tax=Legionella jordanis TaxID=456 RepID=A0A0W0V896_9GAMM|nr:DUF5617 domain-containing protein [Legionella jordanis]KTD16357.1 hypothetical protein Ljor_0663 [Legionella jordanis]RMX04431.1 hypothetical protein EAW55_03075 [Legionella jordanis]VEH12184.1 Uncharacterised protein [Legionella jordanis]